MNGKNSEERNMMILHIDKKEDRMIMLADIIQYERSNRSSVGQLNSKEYKTIVKITMNEWEAWKRENNTSQS
jgi:hypothetical protein